MTFNRCSTLDNFNQLFTGNTSLIVIIKLNLLCIFNNINDDIVIVIIAINIIIIHKSMCVIILFVPTGYIYLGIHFASQPATKSNIVLNIINGLHFVIFHKSSFKLLHIYLVNNCLPFNQFNWTVLHENLNHVWICFLFWITCLARKCLTLQIQEYCLHGKCNVQCHHNLDQLGSIDR